MTGSLTGTLIIVGSIAALFVLTWWIGSKRLGQIFVRVASLLILGVLLLMGFAGARSQQQANRVESERIANENTTLAVTARSEAERASALESKVKSLEYELGEAKQSASVREKDLQAKLDEIQKNAEALARQVSDITEVRDGLLITLNADVLFDSGKAELKCEEKEKLSRILPWLRFKRVTLPMSHLRLTGHTDNQGPDSINDPLSFNRAKAVADYLTRNGIPPEYIEPPVGKGRRQPKGFSDPQPDTVVAKQNVTAEQRTANRRVEVLVADGRK